MSGHSWTTSAIGHAVDQHVVDAGTSAWWSMPSAVLALPWGSRSMTRTLQTSLGQRGRDVHGGGGLADPTLLVRHGENAGVVRLGEDLARQGDPAAGVHGYLARERRVVVGCRQLGSQRACVPARPGSARTSRRDRGASAWFHVERRSRPIRSPRSTPRERSAAKTPWALPRPPPFHVKRRLGRHPASCRRWRTQPSHSMPPPPPRRHALLVRARASPLPRELPTPAQRAKRRFPVKHRPPTTGPRPGWSAKSESAPRSASRVPSTRRHRGRRTPMLAIPGLMEPVQTSTPVTSSSSATQETPEAAPTVSRAGTGSEQHTP